MTTRSGDALLVQADGISIKCEVPADGTLIKRELVVDSPQTGEVMVRRSAGSVNTFVLRDCCIRLQRCDTGSGSGQPEERPPSCPYTTQDDDVSIKCEVSADGTLIKQELEMDSLQAAKAVDVSIECEVGADGTLIKQDLELGPTLIQPRTMCPSQLQTAEAAASAQGPSPSANDDWTSTPLHLLIQASSQSVTPEGAGPSECSSVSDVDHNLSNERTSTTHTLYKHDSVTLGSRTSKRMYMCDYCMYSTHWRGAFVKHVRIHTGVRPYKCEHCDYSASENGTLQKHMRTHTGEKPYKCEHCDYSASQCGNLQSHMRTHTGEKPYKCEHCDYSASHRGNLQLHRRKHTGEKPYKCEHCEYSASRSDLLQAHMRTHTGEKPYKCWHCEYSSSYRVLLQAHMRTHTGEEPYKCKHCDYSASHSTFLKTHIRIHTGKLKKTNKNPDCVKK